MTSLGWNHDEITDAGLSSTRRSMKVAVEFDGPTHYLLGGASGRITPNGATSFKRRLLRILGWEVISIPYFEWNEVRSSKETREAYLRTKLAL